jgi:hypothetical protein
MTHLQCLVPYALEGLLRREIEAAYAELLEVQHGQLVTLQLRLPQPRPQPLCSASTTRARAAWAGKTPPALPPERFHFRKAGRLPIPIDPAS